MKLSGNTVKTEGSAPQMTAYSQQAGFPTIAPAPAQGTTHAGIMSTHQGQFQVISSPPFATSGATAQNTTQYLPQFASYNQQGQLVLSPANFPASAYGQQQIFLTGMHSNPAPQASQQNPQNKGQQTILGTKANAQSAAQQQQQQTAQQQQTLVPMSQPQGGYTLTHNGLAPGQPTFMFANPGPLMGTSQGATGLLSSVPTNAGEAKNEGKSLINYNGLTYSMNPQASHQQAIISPNGQIILRAHEPGTQPGAQTQQAQAQQQIMFSPIATATQQQQAQHSPSGNQGNNLPPPTLQPMSVASSSVGPIRQITVSTASIAGAPPGKTPISRALPTILPTTRPTYTLPQTPVSQASLTPNNNNHHHQAPSPKSKNKFSPRAVASPRAPGPKVPPSMYKPTNTTTTTTIVRAPGGPPVLTQQPPLHHPTAPSQPPTLQPMQPVATLANTTTTTTAHQQQHPLAPSSPKPGASATKAALLKAKPASTPPPPLPPLAQSSEETPGTTPKAFIKPNVLTHVIDGHIIQESSQPFPLETPNSSNSSSSSEDHKGRVRSKSGDDALPLVSVNGSSSSAAPLLSGSVPAPTTTTAKSLVSTQSTSSNGEKKRGPGRPPGSTRQNIDSQRIPGSTEMSSKGYAPSGPLEKRRRFEEPLLKPAIAPVAVSAPNPLKWSVQQVCDFVKSLHGCAEYVEDFMLQEIDGQALMLLKTEHLMAAMSIKLGPALKICSAINEMREELKTAV